MLCLVDGLRIETATAAVEYLKQRHGGRCSIERKRRAWVVTRSGEEIARYRVAARAAGVLEFTLAAENGSQGSASEQAAGPGARSAPGRSPLDLNRRDTTTKKSAPYRGETSGAKAGLGMLREAQAEASTSILHNTHSMTKARVGKR